MRTKILFYGLMLSTFALMLACSKDDSIPDTDGKNELTYDGQIYPLTNGTYETYGFDGEHFNQEFSVFDATRINESLVPVYVFVDLYAAGETFSGGTFPFMHYGQDDVTDKYYFDDGYVILNMNVATEDAESFLAVAGGTVKVSGSGNTYSIAFDLLLDNGKRVTGSFEGTFDELADDVDAGMRPVNRTIQLIKKSGQTPTVSKQRK